MVITWLGQACFKLQSGDLTVVIDPYAKETGLTPPRFKADAVLVTHDHYDHSNAESLTGDPMVIRGPGEYEVKDVYVHGIHTFHDEVQGKERGLNTIYKVEIEGIHIAHLGDFGEKEIRDETLEDLGDVDILLIPVGGKFTIDAETAAKVVKKIEPKIAIPMHYKIPGLKINLDGVEDFLKEIGATKAEAQDKLTIKKKDLAEDEKTKVVLLKTS